MAKKKQTQKAVPAFTPTIAVETPAAEPQSVSPERAIYIATAIGHLANAKEMLSRIARYEDAIACKKMLDDLTATTLRIDPYLTRDGSWVKSVAWIGDDKKPNIRPAVGA